MSMHQTKMLGILCIAHEIFHNLGRKHTLDDYSNNWQINVFEVVLFIMVVIHLKKQSTLFLY